ncbi:hypothetical protein IGJ55_003319 [Enterococcus sp. AZ170]|uniref:DUF6560 family protein n=1 Tax=Enterococcus sp. AZ170 TaxID=2774747 RepID=UPI003D2FC72C
MNNYELEIPNAFKKMLKICIATGIGLFVLFSIFKNATVGHFSLALIFFLIGLLGSIWANSWRVYVTEETIKTRFIFKRSHQFLFSEIDRGEIGLQKELKLFSNGKKIMTIDPKVVNYSKLIKTLKLKNIPIEK